LLLDSSSLPVSPAIPQYFQQLNDISHQKSIFNYFYCVSQWRQKGSSIPQPSFGFFVFLFFLE